MHDSDMSFSTQTSLDRYRLHTRRCLDAIDRSDLNAFISVSPATAMTQATLCDQVAAGGGSLGPLHGLALGVKDLIDVAGMCTTMGSEQYKDRVASQDAAVVRALRSAGAIILGKTNTHEFAYGSTGDRSFFGPVKNPHQPDRVSGGSSSGSAAAVAAGLCQAALGTDTSASVRLPAALCGVVGLKPTYDLLPRAGIFDLSQSLDHVGTLTSCVADAARLLEVMAGRPGHYGTGLRRGAAGLRVGIVRRFYGEYLSPEVQHTVQAAQQALIEAGATLHEVDIPEILDIYNQQQLVLRAEAYANHQEALEGGKAYSDEVQARLLGGRDIGSTDYLRAKARQGAAKAAFDRVLEKVDVLLTATCGIVAPAIDERATVVNGEEYPTLWLLTRLTAPTNFSGHPSISVPFAPPAHLRETRLPVGVQLIGRFHDEATVLQAAQLLEQGGKQER